MSSPTGPAAALVLRISPMAHVAVGFLAVGLLAVVLALPAWSCLLLVIPIGLSVAVGRYRTVVGTDDVTARTFFRRKTIKWEDVEGLRFDRGSWALARLRDGSELRLPAVTFATLPTLTAATGGRVPNPYAS